MGLYRRYVALLALALLTGVPANGKTLHDADFENGTDGLRYVGRPTLSSAAVKIRVFQNDLSQDCSGVIVSDEGHLLTASHCLDICRFNEDGTPTGKNRCLLKVNERPIGFTVLRGNTCNIQQRQKAEVAKKYGKSLADFPANCLDGDLNDFALLKPTALNDLGDFSCLEIGPQKPRLSEEVFAMGFPNQTFRTQHERPNAKDAPGGKLAISFGKVVSSNTCEQRWVAQDGFNRFIFGEREVPEKKEIQEIVKQLWGHSIQTTVDINQGSSGGPLVNSLGQVVGVASVMDAWVHNEKRECRGATFFQPVASLTRDRLSCKRRKSASAVGI